MVRLLGTVPTAPKEVVISLLVDGRALAMTTAVAPAAGDEVARVRRGAWEQILDDKLAVYKTSKDAALKDEIVALSVREGIPTELVALQVDAPADAPFFGSSAPEPKAWAAMLLVAALALLIWRRAAV